MATSDFQFGRIPLNADGSITVKNTDSTYDIVAGDLVTLDATNVVSGTQPVPGVIRSAQYDQSVGVALESIAKGATGRVLVRPGDLVPVVAGASVTAGAAVMSHGAGKVANQGAAKPQVGLAFTGGGNGDTVLIQLQPAKNA